MLPAPRDWTHSEPRALPSADNGFTVGYEHESRLSVTFYQYTRGLSQISSDLDSAAVQSEMRDGKAGINQMVQLGYWEFAQEIRSETVPLGDSGLSALKTDYIVVLDDAKLASSIYVWSHENTFFKVRSTCRFADAKTSQQVIAPLLTAFGSPGSGDSMPAGESP